MQRWAIGRLLPEENAEVEVARRIVLFKLDSAILRATSIYRPHSNFVTFSFPRVYAPLIKIPHGWDGNDFRETFGEVQPPVP